MQTDICRTFLLREHKIVGKYSLMYTIARGHLSLFSVSFGLSIIKPRYITNVSESIGSCVYDWYALLSRLPTSSPCHFDLELSKSCVPTPHHWLHWRYVWVFLCKPTARRKQFGDPSLFQLLTIFVRTLP